MYYGRNFNLVVVMTLVLGTLMSLPILANEEGEQAKFINVETSATDLASLKKEDVVRYKSLRQIKEALRLITKKEVIPFSDSGLKTTIPWGYQSSPRELNMAMANHILKEHKYRPMNKLFIQSAEEGFEPYLVLAARVGKNIWILDPSSDPARPVKLRKWIEDKNFVEPNTLLSLCSAYTYSKLSNCREKDPSMAGPVDDSAPFLTRAQILLRKMQEMVIEAESFL